MRINLTTIFVDDQDKALRFYTDVLRFVVKTELPLGEHRWLTLVSPDDPDGPELALEPEDNPAVRPFKAALVEDGIAYASFQVPDVQEEYDRLREQGIVGIEGVDTRAITRHLRERGAMRAGIFSGADASVADEQLDEQVLAQPSMTGSRLAEEVSIDEAYVV